VRVFSFTENNHLENFSILFQKNFTIRLGNSFLGSHQETIRPTLSKSFSEKKKIPPIFSETIKLRLPLQEILKLYQKRIDPGSLC